MSRKKIDELVSLLREKHNMTNRELNESSTNKHLKIYIPPDVPPNTIRVSSHATRIGINSTYSGYFNQRAIMDDEIVYTYKWRP